MDKYDKFTQCLKSIEKFVTFQNPIMENQSIMNVIVTNTETLRIESQYFIYQN